MDKPVSAAGTGVYC